MKDQPPPADDGQSHDAPTRSLTIAEAHRIMQIRCACHRFDCDRKTAAWCVLVDARRIIPGGASNGRFSHRFTYPAWDWPKESYSNARDCGGGMFVVTDHPDQWMP